MDLEKTLLDLKHKEQALTTKQMRAQVELDSISKEIMDKYGFKTQAQLDKEITRLTKEIDQMEEQLEEKLTLIQEQFAELLELA